MSRFARGSCDDEQNADSNRKIKPSAFFRQIGWREIYSDPPRRHFKVAVRDGSADAILALFHDRFGKAHDRECRQSIADVDLDAHLWRIHAVLSTTQYCCHRHSLAPVRSQAEQTTAHRRVEIG